MMEENVLSLEVLIRLTVKNSSFLFLFILFTPLEILQDNISVMYLL